MIIGQIVTGLKPNERRLMDAVVDDGFALVDSEVKYLDELDGEAIECTMYLWREELMDALSESDWSYEDFQEKDMRDFVDLCKDIRTSFLANKLPDEDLKELALARRRRG